jgi:hypothetical protein
MQFINECIENLTVGVLAEFNDQGLIQARELGRVIGIVSRVYQVQVSEDDPTLKNVAEITTHGYANDAILSGSASWKGCDLYANGSLLTATEDGSPVAVLVPKTLGEDKIDFADGDRVTVIML